MRIYSFDTAAEKKVIEDVPVALAIGVFDGVHLGHQEIFRRLTDYAKGHEGCRSLVITFGTNPKIKNLQPLDTLRLRLGYFESFGIDYTFVIDFSSDFSKMSGREFIRLLCTMCRPKAVIVGEDFKCGSPSDQITAVELSGAFAECGHAVDVDIVPPVQDAMHTRISSTHIRSLISSGDIETANALSGSPYRYDLSGMAFRQRGSVFAAERITDQRLVPDGRYSALLLRSDGREVECTLSIESNALMIARVEAEDLVRADSIRIISKEIV